MVEIVHVRRVTANELEVSVTTEFMPEKGPAYLNISICAFSSSPENCTEINSISIERTDRVMVRLYENFTITNYNYNYEV